MSRSKQNVFFTNFFLVNYLDNFFMLFIKFIFKIINLSISQIHNLRTTTVHSIICFKALPTLHMSLGDMARHSRSVISVDAWISRGWINFLVYLVFFPLVGEDVFGLQPMSEIRCRSIFFYVINFVVVENNTIDMFCLKKKYNGFFYDVWTRLGRI